jgi:hypothetical protein
MMRGFTIITALSLLIFLILGNIFVAGHLAMATNSIANETLDSFAPGAANATASFAPPPLNITTNATNATLTEIGPPPPPPIFPPPPPLNITTNATNATLTEIGPPPPPPPPS